MDTKQDRIKQAQSESLKPVKSDKVAKLSPKKLNETLHEMYWEMNCPKGFRGIDGN
jgi:hypothetical protein